MMGKVIIICGPTGSGKTALAIELARRLNTEIISADSLAIYKNLDIGTAKPNKEEQALAKHHLIDVVSPFDNFSVSDYENLAKPIVDDLLNQGKPPIICGGTGFYINSILYKFNYGGTAENLPVRQEYLSLAKEKGAEFVYEELKKIDLETANKLHPNDVVRVVRAIEIFKATGKKKSEQNDMAVPRYDYLAFTLGLNRQELYSRIDKRVDLMLENGLIEEVKHLLDMGVTIENQCMKGIGYKETYDAIKNNDFKGLADLIKLNSRHYAKRQITFFKKLEGLITLNGGINDMADTVISLLSK